ncbi:hypothetical protein EV424DRAFT_1541293 [Suillus variegatus]|nr:hypothetical protein EV424DRAFT_1541293 [Suillus variegatus]
MLIQVVSHRSQSSVSVSVLIQARAMLIQVVAHRSQSVSVSVLVRARAMVHLSRQPNFQYPLTSFGTLSLPLEPSHHQVDKFSALSLPSASSRLAHPMPPAPCANTQHTPASAGVARTLADDTRMLKMNKGREEEGKRRGERKGEHTQRM